MGSVSCVSCHFFVFLILFLIIFVAFRSDPRIPFFYRIAERRKGEEWGRHPSDARHYEPDVNLLVLGRSNRPGGFKTWALGTVPMYAVQHGEKNRWLLVT